MSTGTVEEVRAKARLILALDFRNIKTVKLAALCGHVNVQFLDIGSAFLMFDLLFIAGILERPAAANTCNFFALTLRRAGLDATIGALLGDLVRLHERMLDALDKHCSDGFQSLLDVGIHLQVWLLD